MYKPKYLFKLSNQQKETFFFIGEANAETGTRFIVWKSDEQLNWRSVKIKKIDSVRSSKTLTLDDGSKISILHNSYFKKATFMPFENYHHFNFKLNPLKHTIEVYNAIKLPHITGLDTSLIPESCKSYLLNTTDEKSGFFQAAANNTNDRINWTFDQFIQAIKAQKQEVVSYFGHAMVSLAEYKKLSKKYNLTEQGLVLTLQIPDTSVKVKEIETNLQRRFGYYFCVRQKDTILLARMGIIKHWTTINQTMQSIAENSNFNVYSVSTNEEMIGNDGKSASACKLK